MLTNAVATHNGVLKWVELLICKYNKHYSVLTLYVNEYCYPLIWLKYDWSAIE